MRASLRKLFFACGVALAAPGIGQSANASPSNGPGNNVRWQSVIGIAQANNQVGSGTGMVIGGGQPWSALSGRVNVRLDTGQVDFDVRGLVLAGGNAIGTPAGIAQVKGTLICDTDGSASAGNSVLIDTPLVDFDDEGDARFSGHFGPLPAVCTTESDIAFLIRVGSGRWIANGTALR